MEGFFFFCSFFSFPYFLFTSARALCTSLRSESKSKSESNGPESFSVWELQQPPIGGKKKGKKKKKRCQINGVTRY